MPRIVPAGELRLIEQVIYQHPEGIGVSSLEKLLSDHFSKPMKRRTLLRRLEVLLSEKRIITQGESVALVYKPFPDKIIVSDDSGVSVSTRAKFDVYVPVSRDGAILRDLLQQPLMLRRPIGYQWAFLEDYEPNINYYLSDDLRAQLHGIGRTPVKQRPAGTYARGIFNRLLIDLSWASSRLEGNTYNHLDTQNLIDFGQAAEGKDLKETQMILNHKSAIEMLIQEADLIGFNSFTFFNLHAILSENLIPDEMACGRLRRRLVNIHGSVFHPLGIPQVIETCFDLLLEKADAILDPFEQAFFIMVQLPYLQPFEDVNKRVSRLGANISLIKNNLCPLSFIDVPEKAYTDGTLAVYEFNQVDLLRDVFIWAYERSCQRYLAITQDMTEPDPLRIQYREVLIQAVQETVHKNLTPSRENIGKIILGKVSENDNHLVINMIQDALHQLHEGSVARYRLKLSEFLSWKPIQDRYVQENIKLEKGDA